MNLGTNNRSICVLKTDQSVWCAGYNGSGQLGNGSTTPSKVPVPVAGLGVSSGVTSVSGSGLTHCAIIATTAKCWGFNTGGQTGDAGVVNRTVPFNLATDVGGTGTLTNITSISSMTYYNGTTTYGSTTFIAGSRAYSVGYNLKGQLGNNSVTASSVIVNVQAP